MLYAFLRSGGERRETKGNAKRYITTHTCENLLWMVFGVASVASFYLKSDGTKKNYQ